MYVLSVFFLFVNGQSGSRGPRGFFVGDVRSVRRPGTQSRVATGRGFGVSGYTHRKKSGFDSPDLVPFVKK